MKQFSFEEINLLCIYNTGSREKAIHDLQNMKTFLEADEIELRDLTDSTIEKLSVITNQEYEALDLYPDF